MTVADRSYRRFFRAVAVAARREVSSQHGTYNRYLHYECRCAECREANNERMKQYWEQKAKERGQPYRRYIKPDYDAAYQRYLETRNVLRTTREFGISRSTVLKIIEAKGAYPRYYKGGE